jgi:Tfp pilus assembly protein PilV
MTFDNPIPTQSRRPAGQGMTLLEAALAMMIMAILSIGVSSLVKTGVETQMSQRTHEVMQTVGVNIVDDLRRDIRLADTATVSSNGRSLSLVLPISTLNSAVGSTVNYQWTAANNFTRQETLNSGGTNTKTYNDPNTLSAKINIDCNDSANGVSRCFTAMNLNNDTTPQPRQIRIDAIRVYQTPGGAGTVIDQYFQAPSFILRKFSFDLISATQFQ